MRPRAGADPVRAPTPSYHPPLDVLDALQPYLELFERGQIAVISQEELQRERDETMRGAFRFAGVDEGFTSEQFDREWESPAPSGDKYQVMEKLVKLPGLRSFDRTLRPPAGVAALDRREDRPRPGEAAGAEAGAAGRPLRDAASAASAPTWRSCRVHRARAPGLERVLGSAGCGGCFPSRRDHGRGTARLLPALGGVCAPGAPSWR